MITKHTGNSIFMAPSSNRRKITSDNKHALYTAVDVTIHCKFDHSKDAYGRDSCFSIARTWERTPWQRSPQWYKSIWTLHPHRTCPNKNHKIIYFYLKTFATLL